VPQLSASSFDLTFSAMSQLKPLAARGKGSVAVILPDTVSSTRYVEFDAPYLKKSMQLAGLSPSQISVQNALGSDATEFSDAQGRQRAGRGRDRLRGRGEDRELRQGPRGSGGRLRPAHPRRQP
jgi:hypothetical protein